MTRQDGRNGYKVTFREALGSPLTGGDEARLRREALVEDLLPDEQDDDVLGKVYDSRLVSRLIDFNLPYLNRIIAAVVMMIVSSIAAVAGPWIIGRAIDQGITA
ncbi:MAG: hypothetical protein KDH90_03220, partial [Anaerolineae bacterium]|nr:hypothetical protein [Anaerolineae bacterium]